MKYVCMYETLFQQVSPFSYIVYVFISADALPNPQKGSGAVVSPPSPQPPLASPVSTLGKCVQHGCSHNVHRAVKLKGKPYEYQGYPILFHTNRQVYSHFYLWEIMRYYTPGRGKIVPHNVTLMVGETLCRINNVWLLWNGYKKRPTDAIRDQQLKRTQLVRCSWSGRSRGAAAEAGTIRE